MRKVIFITLLLLSVYSYSQENTDGHYAIGILPATSSVYGSSSYLESMQATISEAFAGKSRFTVVDRTKFTQVAAERNLQKQEDFINSANIVEQGKISGAQYLISGNITQLSKSGENVEKSKLVLGSDNKLYSQKYYVYRMAINITLNVQVIDVETGMVKSNQSLSETTKTETTDEQVAVGNAIRGLEGNLRGWANDVFPVYMKIIKIESTNKKGLPETVLIKGGSEMDLGKTKVLLFNKSSELGVYYNETLQVDGKDYTRQINIGKVKLDELQGEFSICKVKSGAEEIKKKLEEGKTLLLKIISY